uniref:Secreted protein n=1 Tax=Oryza barthii TaxID=65489 RepID=A0A0D3FK76_9ORYZ
MAANLLLLCMCRACTRLRCGHAMWLDSRPLLWGTDSGDALERHNPNEGTAVVSPPSLVDSSGENHALVRKADDSGVIGVVTFLKAPL